MNLNCIIIEDDLKSAEGLKSYIRQIPNLEIQSVYSDPVEALSSIRGEKEVDIIFIDIEMPNINGVDLSKVIRERTKKLVFTTAHKKYGYDAFMLNVDDYLLKPYTFARFAEVINKLFPLQTTTKGRRIPQRDDYFFVRDKNDKNKIVKINLHQVITIESLGNYVRIILSDKVVLAYLTLAEISDALRDHQIFIQIHRKFIVSKNAIDSIGDDVRLKNQQFLPIGKKYKNSLAEFAKGYLGRVV